MSWRLIVFDWDGTLMDSQARIVASLRAAARDIAAPERSDSELADVIGLGLVEALQQLFPELEPADQTQLVERYRHHFLVAEPTPTRLFDGVGELLAQLEAAGYLLAVATGKARRGLDRVLAETGLKGRFHATRCADESRSKPHPQMLLEVMELTGVAAHETVMVGDTVYDLEMARHAGTASVGVSWGVHAVERLQGCAPLACIDRWDELPALLASTRPEVKG